jgi:hypothetical protein
MAQAAWILAVGATLVGAAVWLGTSGDASLFVGDGGIGQEKSGIQRIPWHSIESLAFDSIGQRLVVRGNDEAGSPVTIHVSLKGHPQAAAWLLKEARQRIPSVVAGLEISTLEPNGDAGVVVPLGDVQVVGKRCAASGKIIAFEPDARVCPQCERVYHKAHLPKACACGATLGSADATAVEGSHPADASSQGKKSEESSTS